MFNAVYSHNLNELLIKEQVIPRNPWRFLAVQRSKVKDTDFAWSLIICCNFEKEKLYTVWIIPFTVFGQDITKVGFSW